MASASTPTLTGNERTARRSPEEIASEGSVGLIDETYAENAPGHSPLGEARGHGKLEAQISGFKESLSDFLATIEDVITEGDTIAMRITLRGIHDGAFMGTESTGRPIEVGNMVSTRTEDGVIAERWIQSDTLGILTQLSVVEPSTT